MARPLDPPMRRRDRRAAERLTRPAHRKTRGRSRPRPAWQSPMVLITAAAILLGAGIIAVALPKAPAGGEELRMPPVAYPAELIAGDTIGRADAPVVVELYSDFQCPACRMFVTQQLHRLVDEVVAPGIARIEARDIAFLGRTTPDESLALAVGASCAAEQGRYWPFHDLVFWNQGRENRGDHSAAFIERVAAEAGLDASAFNACVDRPAIGQAISARTQAALSQGINSTPTLVVNGQPVVGVPDYDEFVSLISGLAAGSPAPGAASVQPS